ncbi:MAG: hydroxyacid dehydrogenase [Bacteroidales bacterium]|nr:hydroxyacid dehydrogenase [Bacteroidales bacterium]
MNKNFTILIVDDVDKILLDKLNNAGFSIIYKPGLELDGVLQYIATVQGIILRSKVVADKKLIDLGINLKFIARVGAGMEIIDIPYAESKGIQCINSPEGNKDAVGEQAVGMLLSLLNNLNKADSEVRQKIWEREGNRGIELLGKTVGIIGYGNMGSAFARRLSGFGVKTIAYDKYKTNFSDAYAQEVSLQTLQAEADVISLHVPQTEETIYMIDKEFIAACSKPFILINTARGKVINTQDVVDAMKQNKIVGAALDVLEYESFNFQDFMKEDMPEAFTYLVQSNRTILTPHIAGWTVESKTKLASVLADKIISRFSE